MFQQQLEKIIKKKLDCVKSGDSLKSSTKYSIRLPSTLTEYQVLAYGRRLWSSIDVIRPLAFLCISEDACLEYIPGGMA